MFIQKDCMQYHDDGSLPLEGQIFVYGSNLSGIHGAGAALLARKRYGAVLGVGVGYVGRSYGIPTKDRKIQVLDLETIYKYVWQFKEFARTHPHLTFFVTRVGCGLSGYSDLDIAPMFIGSSDNCSFAKQWKPFLEYDPNSPISDYLQYL